MEFPDNRIGEIKRDWTRLELSPNHQSDSTMIHGKRLKTGESSWDGMPISESLTDTPGKGFHEDVEMEDTQEKIIGGGTNDAANFHHKIFLEFQAWIKIIFGLNLPEDQKIKKDNEAVRVRTIIQKGYELMFKTFEVN
ncbi:hypothetical protein PCANC_15998 [Puccinia coronata f. sp. avenae]|uniref:Uncharacterized protein n=1 Tax=Puccinia coronata f. sp. avenae TaxID=200324 RepID=A0A2N5VRT9_9BASI|nr:hypothetical protein PCASD_02160 [Puccinia coronata f. sp. avenae]PLW52711.1 hypothetical protein PCANC_15998 [Puccinia coronata f. sp. avenae]